MTSEYEIYFNEFCKSGAWFHEDVSECGCKGRGWFLSQLDTWHKCSVHNDGQPDPEYGTDEEWEAYEAAKARKAYKALGEKALREFGQFGVTAAGFNSMARGHIEKADPDPEDWVVAAKLVIEALEEIIDYDPL